MTVTTFPSTFRRYVPPPEPLRFNPRTGRIIRPNRLRPVRHEPDLPPPYQRYGAECRLVFSRKQGHFADGRFWFHSRVSPGKAWVIRYPAANERAKKPYPVLVKTSILEPLPEAVRNRCDEMPKWALDRPKHMFVKGVV